MKINQRGNNEFKQIYTSNGSNNTERKRRCQAVQSISTPPAKMKSRVNHRARIAGSEQVGGRSGCQVSVEHRNPPRGVRKTARGWSEESARCFGGFIEDLGVRCGAVGVGSRTETQLAKDVCSCQAAHENDAVGGFNSERCNLTGGASQRRWLTTWAAEERSHSSHWTS